MGRTMGCPEETNSFGALLLFHPCPSANYPSFAPDPILPTLNPAPAWDRASHLLLLLHLPSGCTPSPGPQPPHPCCPRSPLMLVPQLGPVTRQGPCVGFCPCSPQPMGDGSPKHCPGPWEGEGKGTKRRGVGCPVSAQQQHPDRLLFWGKAGLAAGASGPAPLCPPRTSFEGTVCRGRGVC